MQKKALRCTAEVMIIFVVLSSGRHDVVSLWCSRAKAFLDATIVKTNISLRNLAAAPLRVLFFSIIWFVLVLSQENTASKFCFGSNQRKFLWVEGERGHHLFYVKSSFHLVPFRVIFVQMSTLKKLFRPIVKLWILTPKIKVKVLNILVRGHGNCLICLSKK